MLSTRSSTTASDRRTGRPDAGRWPPAACGGNVATAASSLDNLDKIGSRRGSWRDHTTQVCGHDKGRSPRRADLDMRRTTFYVCPAFSGRRDPSGPKTEVSPDDS